MAEKPREIEAKLSGSIESFRALERLEEIAGWRVVERHSVELRDAYWDTPDHRLGCTGRTLRVRAMDGAPVGELTYKGAPEDGGRTEENASAPAGSGPRDWERLTNTEAKQIVTALHEQGILAALRLDIVLLNPRRELVLRKGASEEVLSLDEVRIESQPYLRRYVELELKHGSREEHDALTHALQERFHRRPIKTGKVHAARQWLERRPS